MTSKSVKTTDTYLIPGRPSWYPPGDLKGFLEVIILWLSHMAAPAYSYQTQNVWEIFLWMRDLEKTNLPWKKLTLPWQGRVGQSTQQCAHFEQDPGGRLGMGSSLLRGQCYHIWSQLQVESIFFGDSLSCSYQSWWLCLSEDAIFFLFFLFFFNLN